MINFLYLMLPLCNSLQEQLSCKYLENNSIPLGKPLEQFSLSYIEIDFQKYKASSQNISEQKHFIIYKQYENSSIVPKDLTGKFGLQQKIYKYKAFNFDAVNVSIKIKFQPDFQTYLINKELSCKDIEPSLKNILFTYTPKSPNRASFGEQKQFPIILSEQYLSAYQLPINLPDISELIIVDEIGDITPTISNPSDQPFWKGGYTVLKDSTLSQEVTTVAIPWLPFFSQCQGYGKHIYLFELLESSDGCNFVDPNDVKLVQTIPTTGLEALADSCFLQLKCFYEENVTETDNVGLRWWQSEGDDPLFFISSSAISPGTFFDNKADQKSTLFADMITEQSDDLIGVKFVTDGVFKNSIPTNYHLTIKYNQLTKNTKKIVTAQVTASNYKQKNQTINQYELFVTYQAMNYLELINTFQVIKDLLI